VEALAAEDDRRREVVLVHERDPRLGAPVAGDEAHEQRDRERVGEQDAEQQRRAAQDEHVLAQHQKNPAHAERVSTRERS
jgi:hypothetical protein